MSCRSITLAAILLLLWLAHHAVADTFSSGENQFEIEFVTIDDPGNPPDKRGVPDPLGQVDYEYRIGKYEISRQMIEKANAEAELGIQMHPMDFVIGGSRPQMPATAVSWNDAARFVNWLNESEGFPAAYKFATQPGDAGYNSNENIMLWGRARD